MTVRVKTRPIERCLLGDTRERVVHDLRFEVPECNIDEILAEGSAVVFLPETRAQAFTEGYDDCGWCIRSALA